MIDSVIFDLDGTLWDASEQIYRYWQNQFPKLTLKEMKEILGKTQNDIASHFGIPVEKVYELQKGENLYLRTNPGNVYAGVEETVDTLYHRGLKLFIASNCQSGYIDIFLSSSGLETYFENTICCGDTKCPKTKNVKHLIERYNLSPVMVGDTESDSIAAIYNRIPFIWASYGFSQLEHTLIAGKLSQPTDLLNLIKEVN